MEIHQATAAQAGEIFDLLQACRRALEAEGIFQWTDAYPALHHVEEDLASGDLFVYMDGGVCAGTVLVNRHQDPEYQTVAWAGAGNTCNVIHRLAVHPRYQGRGIAQQLMDFAEDFARRQGSTSIRLDAYAGNPRSLRFYENRRYIKRGEVCFSGRTLPFHCYEKQL